MVADAGAALSCYSVNHGAGRQLGRRAAKRVLDQGVVDRSFDSADILTNCRNYPIDEAPAAYKDFNEVLAPSPPPASPRRSPASGHDCHQRQRQTG